MGIIKNICARIAFSKEQRVVIWNALSYSNYSYHRKGNVDKAGLVSTIMNQTERVLGVTGKKFTKKEVSAMLEEYGKRIKEQRQEELKQEYENGRRQGIIETLDNLEHGRGIVVGEVFEVEEDPNEMQENKEISQREGTGAPITEGAEAEGKEQEEGEQNE